MILTTFGAISILLNIILTPNVQGCASDLCPNPSTDKCCSSELVGSEYKTLCCPAGKSCCGSNCCDVCCGGNCCPPGYVCCSGSQCCPAGSACCSDGHCCPAGSSCCGSGCCDKTCCRDGRCIKPGDSCECLYDSDFVLLQDGSKKQLKYLRSGDKVYSVNNRGQIVKDEIIMILHRGSDVQTAFYTITTSSNKSLSLTGDHSIMTYNPANKHYTMVAANELKVNDYLVTDESNSQNVSPVSITSIELVYKEGFITPMTYTGKILVNDIAVSCYVNKNNVYNEMHMLLYPFRLYYYLVKDVFHLSNEPYSTEMEVTSINKQNEFYGHTIIRNMHQFKDVFKYIIQDLMLHTLLNI